MLKRTKRSYNIIADFKIETSVTHKTLPETNNTKKLLEELEAIACVVSDGEDSDCEILSMKP